MPGIRNREVAPASLIVASTKHTRLLNKTWPDIVTLGGDDVKTLQVLYEVIVVQNVLKVSIGKGEGGAGKEQERVQNSSVERI